MTPNRVVNRFERREQVGSGSTSTVYRAWDHRDGRTVALKVIAGDSRLARARYWREVRALQRATPAASAGLVAAAVVDRDQIIAIELIEGTSLLEYFAHHTGGIGLDRMLEISASLAEAVGSLHAAGVVHRDLTPPNLVREPGGRWRLLDLGSAWTPEFDDLDMPDVRARGSARYAPPEQLHGYAARAASDIFALGVLIVEMLSGARAHKPELPLPRGWYEQRRRALLDTAATAGATPGLLALLGDMLQLDAASRPDDARIVAERIRGLRYDSPVA